MGLLIRILARLMAMGALTGSGILLLICCISTPVFTQFTFSTTTFGDGGVLRLGIWGFCYQPAGGQNQCSGTSIGYEVAAVGLPNYSANPGAANLNIVNKPLSASLIFFPLATGATFLALLLSLLPIRIVTILAIGVTFLAIGATVIAFVLAIVCFGQANARLGLLFNPNTFVNPIIGRCVWFAVACATAEAGAFIFLLAALSPKKTNNHPVRAYGDPPARHEKTDGVDYGFRKSISDRPRTRTGSAYDDYEDNGMARQSSVRSQGSGRRSRRYSMDEYERPRRTHSSTRSGVGGARSRPARDAYEEDSYEPGY